MTNLFSPRQHDAVQNESVVGPAIIVVVMLVAFAFLTAISVANIFFPTTEFAQWSRHVWQMRQASGPLPPPLH